MKKTKLFNLKLKVQEVVEEEEFTMTLFPLFENSQICSGVDQVKSVLSTLKERLDELIENTLNPNDKQK